MAKAIPIVPGERYTRLVVVGQAESRMAPCGKPYRMVECLCDCGKSTVIGWGSLRSGNTQSCGCLRDEAVSKAQTTHGLSRHPAYFAYTSMHQRVRPNANNPERYIERGIDVCDEWTDDVVAFIDWAEKSGFKKGLELDRINNDLGYSPDNCRWVTREVNGQNRAASYWWVIDGVAYESGAEVFKAIGIKQNSLRSRVASPNWPNYYKIPRYPNRQWWTALHILLSQPEVTAEAA